MTKKVVAESEIENDNFKENIYIRQKIAAVIATILAVFHLVTAYIGAMGALQQRVIQLTAVLIMVFLLKPTTKKARSPLNAIDFIFIAASAFFGIYIFQTAERFVVSAIKIESIDIIVGMVGLILVLEATRRIMGWVMPAIAIVFLFYVYFGPYLPSIISHRGFGFSRIAYQMFFTFEGVLGQPMGVSATFVAVFIIFAAFLRKSGAGEFFMNVAFAVFGRYRGGPAKAAVVGSSLFGTFSGSAVANVVGTGTFTIPLMKSAGYSPDFAGAVEAVASTGGQIMPPVMGAAAFLMTEYLGVPYTKIALAAILPAFLYFFAVYIMVDTEAAKHNLCGLPKEKLPDFKAEMKKGWPFLIPLFVLIILLGLAGRTPSMAGFWGTIAVIAIAIIHPKYRFTLKDFYQCLESGGRGVVEVAAACATAGIIIGSITLTGLGLKLSMMLVTLAGGNLFLLLILTAIVCIILGMGVPTTAAYLVVATLVAPALIKMGVYPMAAHMFVFYYALVSMITPPVALASYAAAGIAQSNPSKTGFTAVRLGIVALVVPFMFVYGPQLLLKGSAPEVTLSIITSIIGCYALAVGVHGYHNGDMKIIPRILVIVGGLGLIKPGLNTDVLGLACIFLGMYIPAILRKGKKKKDAKKQV